MRVKKTYKILTFSTTTSAMGMEKYCFEHKIPGRLIPVPREISAGCGICWRMGKQEYEEYKELFSHVEYENIVELMM